MKAINHLNETGSSCKLPGSIRGSLIAAAVMIAATICTHAQTWDTVVTLGGQGSALMIDPFSEDTAQPGIFLGGNRGTDLGGRIFHYKTSTDVLTTVDSSPGLIKRFATDSQGNIFAIGQSTAGNISRWLVMKSPDGGVSWETIDHAGNWHPNYGSYAKGVTIDPERNVFVSGYVMEKNGRSWRVRRGVETASGYTWSDSLKFSGNAQGGEILYVPSVQGKHAGGIYAVGHTTPKSLSLWTVMRSGNGGASWQSVDTWSPSKSTAAAANAITSDLDGNIYVVGYDSGRDPSGWWMRQSLNGGASWNLIGPKYSIGSHNQPLAVAADPWGNVFVAGYTGAGGRVNWTVRGWSATTGWDNWPASVRHPMEPTTSRAMGLAVTALGDVYVTGSANELGWLVQRLIP